MKSIFIILLLSSIGEVFGQTVNITGELIDRPTNEIYFLGNGERLIQLNLDKNDRFHLEIEKEKTPSTITINTVSKKGKINQLFPIVWLDAEDVELTFDFTNNLVDIKDSQEYQKFSEKLEGFKPQKRLEHIKENLNQVPALYFLEKDKETLEFGELEKMLGLIDAKYDDLKYVIQLKSYVKAKRMTPIKKGKAVNNFELPDKNGVPQPILRSNGKTKVIALLSTGCYFSLSSISQLNELHQKDHESVEIVSIWLDKSQDVWMNQMREHKHNIEWLDLWDEKALCSAYFGNKISPSFLVINHDNILIDRFSGYGKRTKRKLDRLFQ